MIIRPIKQEDNLTIGSIIQQVLREFKADKPGTAYFDEQLFDLHTVFTASSTRYWIIELEGKIVGGCGILPNQHLPAGYCELVKLYLLPEARGMGLGKVLIDQCLLSAKEFGFSHVYLETLPELDKAIPLYEKMGFKYLPSSLGQTGHFGCSIWMVKEL
jgi:putative acetyltransferase